MTIIDLKDYIQSKHQKDIAALLEEENAYNRQRAEAKRRMKTFDDAKQVKPYVWPVLTKGN